MTARLTITRDSSGYHCVSWPADDGESIEIRYTGSAPRMPLDLPARYRRHWDRAAAMLASGASLASVEVG
jgi:hypothetical protein